MIMNKEMYKYLQNHNYISRNTNKNPLRQQELSTERAECIACKCNSILEEKDEEIERLNNIIDELEECLKYWLKLSEENKNMSNYTIYSNVLDILKELKEDDKDGQ